MSLTIVHRVIPRNLLSKRQVPDYEPDWDYGGFPKESGIAWAVWVSRNPTHYYDHQTGLKHSLENDAVVNPWEFGDGRAILVGQRYRSLEELRASLES